MTSSPLPSSPTFSLRTCPAPILAACALQFTFGLLYASGVFIAILESPSFTLAIGLAGFSTSIGITFAGLVMNKAIPSSNMQSAPTIVAVAGALALYAQSFMSPALVHKLYALLFTAAAVQGMGAGAIYVASVDVLQAWVPRAPGLVTGLGMLCGGAGSLIGIPLYAKLVQWLGSAEAALAVAGILTGTCAVYAAMWVRRPPRGWAGGVVPTEEELLEDRRRAEDELSRLIPPSAPRLRREVEWPTLGVGDIVGDAAFWGLLGGFAATVGPGFGVVLGFQSMMEDMFGVGIERANRLFFWVTAMGVGGRLVAGAAVDALERVFKARGGGRDGGNEGMKAAKCANVGLLLGQALALAAMPFCIKGGYVVGFSAAAGIVYFTFSGGPVVATCLARGIFMPNNTSLAFSLLAVSIGLGDIFFSGVIAWSGQTASVKGLGDSSLATHQNDYNLFLVCGILWSVMGLGASALIKVSKRIASLSAEGEHDELE